MLQVNALENGVYQLEGELTRDTVPGAWPELASLWHSQTAPQVIDLSALKQTDSAGLAWLVHILQQARQHKVSVKFRQPPEQLMKLAKISETQTLLPLE